MRLVRGARSVGGSDRDVVCERAVPVVDGAGIVVGELDLVIDDELEVVCAGQERDDSPKGVCLGAIADSAGGRARQRTGGR